MLVLMEKMLRHVLENGHTQFDGKYSLQIAGLGMGTPGAPILVNITLAIVENNFVAELKNVLFFKLHRRHFFVLFKQHPRNPTPSCLEYVETCNSKLHVTPLPARSSI